MLRVNTNLDLLKGRGFKTVRTKEFPEGKTYLTIENILDGPNDDLIVLLKSQYYTPSGYASGDSFYVKIIIPLTEIAISVYSTLEQTYEYLTKKFFEKI